MSSKLSAEKQRTLDQRQKKLASALRTNLRRRKEQARERNDTGDATGDDQAPDPHLDDLREHSDRIDRADGPFEALAPSRHDGAG